MTPTDLDYAWASGLIEGEGCFTLHSDKHPYFLMDMTDLDVLERFQKVFPKTSLRGPYFHKNKPNNKARYRIDAFGPPCLEIMEKVKPFMCKRRTERINEILSKIASLKAASVEAN